MNNKFIFAQLEKGTQQKTDFLIRERRDSGESGVRSWSSVWLWWKGLCEELL